MAESNEQGTGKHPHKSTEQPYPHHEGQSEEGGHSQQASADRERNEESGSSDLQAREYRDAQGNVHHHTTTYEEQHGGEQSASHGGGEHKASHSSHSSSEHQGSGEHRGGRESAEEKHEHLEEGAQKRAQEIREEHGHAKK